MRASAKFTKPANLSPNISLSLVHRSNRRLRVSRKFRRQQRQTNTARNATKKQATLELLSGRQQLHFTVNRGPDISHFKIPPANSMLSFLALEDDQNSTKPLTRPIPRAALACISAGETLSQGVARNTHSLMCPEDYS